MYKIPKRNEVGEYYSKYYPKMMELWEKNNPDPRPFLLRKLGVGRLNKKRILDIGCGTGKMMKDLKILKRNEVYGIDISRKFIKMALKNGIKASFCDVEKKGNLPYEEEFFDVIFMLDFLEHIFYPQSLFKKSYRILKPKGRIYATVPNWLTKDKKDNIQKIYETSLQKVYKRKIPDKAKRYADFNLITINEIRKIIKSTGFKIKEIHGFKWRWKELRSKEKKLLWNNPLKGRDFLLVIEKAR